MNLKVTVLSFAVVAAGAANATTWVYDWRPGDPGMGGNAGAVRAIDSTFNSQTNRLTYSVTMEKEAGQSSSQVNGFYLAMNDGPNPKGKTGELAFLYFDATNAHDLKLTAYGYRGDGNNSWQDGSTASGTQNPDKILTSVKDKTWVNSLAFKTNTDGSRTLSFDINASRINNRTPLYPSAGVTWDGIEYDSKVGIWFGALKGVHSSYGTDGYLSNFGFSNITWVDTTNQQAVPEPATMTILGLIAAARARKRKKSA
ncbi:MAG: hypothetical protein LCH41_04340 [Armatimonadetes bacterium]|nr:hypothetical protein [Armatimonadota bacterium]